MKKSKLRTAVTVIIPLFFIVALIGVFVYINYDSLKLKSASRKIKKSLKEIYNVEVLDFKAEVVDEPGSDIHFVIDGLEFDDSKTYYKFYFRILENGGYYRGLADAKGNIYCDSYVNRVYGEETTAYLTDLIDNSGVLEGKDYLMVFDPWMACDLTGPYQDFDEYKANYNAGASYIRPLFYLGIVGEVSDEQLDALVDMFAENKSPFNIKIYTVFEDDYDMIMTLDNTYGENCELTRDNCRIERWTQEIIYTKADWNE